MPNKIEQRAVPAQAVTSGPKQHFFGYYDKNQFDPSDRYLLGLQCDVIGRMQTPDDRAEIGVVDLEGDNAWIPLAETAAWNWQMGCMAEWLPGTESSIIHNDRRDGRFVSVIRDLDGREERVLPHPFFELAPDGKSALTLNFARLWDLRPETGYCGLEDPWQGRPAPEDDGIHGLDLGTGEQTLLISHADMAQFPPTREMPDGFMRYFTHLLFNEDGSRFMFWYRCAAPEGGRPSYCSGVYTASLDGKDIWLLNDKNSHCTWYGRDKVLAWATHQGVGPTSFLFRDRTDEAERFGDGLLEFNAHATFSPDGKWLLGDIPAGHENMRGLVLYDCDAGSRVDIARLHSLPDLQAALRCDLHPRWNRSGSQVCIDSTHEGSRQMYLFDVEEIVNESPGTV